jgi:RimJ/RimL family protein N-acetyltransferase
MTRLRIQLGRLLLDPFTLMAARDLYAIRNHPSVRKFMSNSTLISYASHRAWLRSHLVDAPDLHLWLVRPQPKARAIGFTQLRLNAAQDIAEIGVMFKEPQQHRLPAALSTAVTLHLAFARFHYTWVTSYVIPSHQHAIAFNQAWGASIVESDKSGMVLLKLHRDACFANDNYHKIMMRLGDRLHITEC